MTTGNKVALETLEGEKSYIERVLQEDANYKPLGATSEKGCANCRWFVPEYASCTVVQDWPDPIVATGLSDLFLARTKFEPEPLEVIIVEGSADKDADDDEPTDTGDKADKTEGGIKFQARDYASVPDADKPSTWKLRMAEERSGNFTIAQVARAITALQPSGFRGQRVELTSDERTKAIGRIRSAIGKTGGTDDQKKALRTRLNNLKSQKSMLQQVKDWWDRRSEKALVFPEAPSSFQLTKDRNGEWRWVAMVTNKFRDIDSPSEIFTDQAHKDYMAYLDENPDQMPEAWLWHTPGTKWGNADFADYINGFVIMSGTVDPGMEAVAEKLASESDLGVSHGYFYQHENQKSGIIGMYRTFEVSPLERGKEANPWTGMDILREEEMTAFSASRRAFLADKLGEEKVLALESGTETLEKTLEEAGVDFKGYEATPDRNLTDEDTTAVGAAAAKALFEGDGLKELQTMIASLKEKADKVPALAEAVEVLQTTVKDGIQKAAEDLVTATINNGQGKRPTQDDKNVIPDGDPLKTAEPTMTSQFVQSLVGAGAKPQ